MSANPWDENHPLQRSLRDEQARMAAQSADHRQDLLARGYSPRHTFTLDQGGDTHPILSLNQFQAGKGIEAKTQPVTRYQEAHGMPQTAKSGPGKGRKFQAILNESSTNRVNLN